MKAYKAQTGKLRKGRVMSDGLRDTYGPVGRFVMELSLKSSPCPKFRSGIGWEAERLDIGMTFYKWAHVTENSFLNIIDELKANYAEAEKLWNSYESRLQEFRSAAKNDVASLEAHARKTTEAVQKMNKAYGDVITQMNSPEMLQAVQNAERLAAAMNALANLQSHRLVLAVTDQAPVG